jgi:hypothetical protein
MNQKSVVALVLVLVGALGWAQVTSDFTLTAYPTVNIPLGPALSDGTPYYSIGGGLSVKGEYTPPFAQFLYGGLALGADMVPINSSKNSLTLLSLGTEVGVQFYPVPRLGLRLAACGGEYAGLVAEGTVLNPYIGGLADISYLLNPALSLGLGASYKYCLTPADPLYQGVA